MKTTRLKFRIAIVLFVGAALSSFQNCGGFASQRFPASLPLLGDIRLATGNGGPSSATVVTDSTVFHLTNLFANVQASYAGCPSQPVRFDVYRVVNGSGEFQARCYTDVLNPGIVGFGNCQLPEPVTIGSDASSYLVRFWNATPACNGTYAEPGQAGELYQDYFFGGTARADHGYKAAVDGAVMASVQRSYEVRIDPRTGAIFELYNRRANRRMNAIHPNVGSASQFAFHNNVEIMSNACGDGSGGVKYWNPNQAGSFCSYMSPANKSRIPNTPMSTTLRSTQSDGSELFSTAAHNMMAWAYGVGYEGPWNEKDTAELQQNLRAYPDYFTVDMNFTNRGEPRAGFMETPAFYMSAGFRNYVIQLTPSSPRLTASLPHTATSNVSDNIDATQRYDAEAPLQSGPFYYNHDTRWASFSHAEDPQNVYTLAWFRSAEVREDAPAGANQVSLQLAQSAGNVKFGTYQSFTARTNRTYRFKYAVFPYGPDEVIDFRGQRRTVLQAVQIMRQQFEGARVGAVQTGEGTRTLRVTNASETLGENSASQLLDGRSETFYSSNSFSGAVADRVVNLSAFFSEGALERVNTVRLTARKAGGQIYAFPRKYNVYISNGSSWDLVSGEIDWQPDGNGNVLIPFPERMAQGVLIVPLEVTRDSAGGAYYFQLGELALYKR